MQPSCPSESDLIHALRPVPDDAIRARRRVRIVHGGAARALSMLAIAGLLAAACGEPATAPAQVATALVVTDPVSPAAGFTASRGSAVAPAASVAAADGLAFVSLSPGVEPGGTEVTILNRRTHGSVSAPMANGGFDPVGIGAMVGDTLDITIALPKHEARLATSIVPATRPPRVVRTIPAQGRTDVAINATMAVIFSEPIDPATLDQASVQLLRNGSPVRGFVRPLAGSTTVEFVPNAALVSGANYQLVLGDRIADLAGDRLQAAETFEFTTALAPADSGTQASAWVGQIAAPTIRYHAATAVVNGILYVIGGNDETTGVLRTVEAFDPATGIWTARAPMPTAREGLAVGVISGIIYAVGGSNNGFGWSYLSTVEAYDPATNTWAIRTPMPTARGMLAVGVIGGTLYAAGGESMSGVLATVEAYDPVADRWTVRAVMPTARGRLVGGVVDGHLYAAGGRVSNARWPNALATLEVYDPVSNTWTSGAPMPTRRMQPAMAIVNGTLHVIGGIGSDGVALASVEVFDAASNTWASGPPLSDPKGWWNGAAFVNGVIYAIPYEGMLSYRP